MVQSIISLMQPLVKGLVSLLVHIKTNVLLFLVIIGKKKGSVCTVDLEILYLVK